MLISSLKKKIQSGRTQSKLQRPFIAKFLDSSNRSQNRPSLSTTPLRRPTLSCTPPVHNIKVEPARIADHDAFAGQIIGGAVSPFSADKAIHALTIWEFLF